MRNFDDADKKKKQARIRLPENPAGLSPEAFSQLQEMVKSSLKDGYLPCGAAFKIAKQANVPKIAVGAATDKLGIRIANCQIGCFKVGKNLHENETPGKIDQGIVDKLAELKEKDELTCANVFALAQQMKLTPMAVADVANARNLRVHHCQLGCF